MENFITVYFVTENGFMHPMLVRGFLKQFEEKGFPIRDIGIGSAYNMPIYLLGEIEEHIEEAVVVSAYMDGDRAVPMVFFSKTEIDAVMEGLEAADEGQKSFDVLKEVHRKIRS